MLSGKCVSECPEHFAKTSSGECICNTASGFVPSEESKNTCECKNGTVLSLNGSLCVKPSACGNFTSANETHCFCNESLGVELKKKSCRPKDGFALSLDGSMYVEDCGLSSHKRNSVCVCDDGYYL